MRKGPSPAAPKTTRDYLQDLVTVDPAVPPERANVMFDAQTSGGLLVAVAPRKAEILLESLHHNGVPDAVLVGAATAGKSGKDSAATLSISPARKIGTLPPTVT